MMEGIVRDTNLKNSGKIFINLAYAEDIDIKIDRLGTFERKSYANDFWSNFRRWRTSNKVDDQF